MPYILEKEIIELPGKLTGLGEDDFLGYLGWERKKPEISKRILNQFKKGACLFTGYDDENRPDTKVENDVPAGNLLFRVTTVPVEKKISYSDLNHEFGRYLNFLLERHVRGKRQEGIVTIKGEPYVSLDELFTKMKQDEKTMRTGKTGVSQSLSFLEPAELADKIPKRMAILYKRDYSILNDYNGRMYVMGKRFIEEGNRNTGDFKQLILDDSLQTLGEEPRKVTKLSYPFEKFTFVNSIEPRTTTKHANVVRSLFAEPKERITKKSRIGDLAKIRMIYREGAEDFLREKGLLDDDLLFVYKPEIRGDAILVRLYGLREKLDHYRRMHSGITIEQNIYMEITD